VPIYRLLQDSAFEPDVIAIMTTAFEEACRELGLAERNDPLRDIVATTIIGWAQKGILDPDEMRKCVRQAIADK
jgi:hypothetical protein